MNPRRIWLAFAVVMLCVLFTLYAAACAATYAMPAQGPVAPADDAGQLYLPLISSPPEPPAAKLGSDFGNLITVTGVLEQDFPLAKQMGAQWTRIEVPWLKIEASQGVYTWEAHDAVVQRAAELGNNILLLIHSAPDWAAEESCGPITDTAAFETFLAAAIARYGDKVDAWEFMNEPDGIRPRPEYGPTIGCWAPYPDQYAEQLKLFYNKVKELDPTAKVMFGSLAYDDPKHFDGDFLSNVLRYGAGQYFDLLGIHFYPIDPERFPTAATKVNEVRAMMSAQQVWNKEIWITETSMWTNSNGSLGAQRRFITRYLTYAFCAGAGNQFWFGIRQEGDADLVPRHRWLINIDHEPDQAYDTFQVYAAQISGMTCRGAYTAVPGDVEAYRFTGPENALLYVVWATGDDPSTIQLPAQTGVTVTERSGQVKEVAAQNGSVVLDVPTQGIYVAVH